MPVSTYYVAWWNLENLFDEENSPRRSEKLQRTLGSSIVGWTPALRDKKIEQLASVIVQMNGGNGPDLLGVCEIENAFVLQKLADDTSNLLPNRNYQIVHADTADERGIDVAFIFDPQFFTAPPDEIFQHVVMRRTATREIVQVNFQTHKNHTWSILGNHWPSRSGGAMESAGYRSIAGETLAYYHQRILEVHGSDTPVLAMGDFNDEPFDPSVEQYALGTRQRPKVIRGTSPRLWNLMWSLMGSGEGTFYFDNFANILDQFLVNKSMAKETGWAIRAIPESVEIVKFPGMSTSSTDYPQPIRFGGMGKPVDQAGYSDHYPIGMLVEEID